MRKLFVSFLALVLSIAQVQAGGSSPGLPLVGAPVLNSTNSTVLTVDSSGLLANTTSLSVNVLNGGSGATSSTFWRGDGTWASPGGGGGITIGTSTITSGTNTRILYDNSGVVGEYTLTGSGTVVAMATSPVFVTPSLGVALASSINGLSITSTSSTLTIPTLKTVTISKTMQLTAADDTGVYTLPTGTKTLAAIDVATLSSLTSIGTIGTGVWQGTVVAGQYGGTGVANTGFTFTLAGTSAIPTLTNPSSGVLQHGAADADTTAAMVAQIIRSQGALTGGTSNQSGVNLTIAVSPGKGTGTGGSFIVQTAPAGTTGTTVGTLTTALTIDSTQKSTFAGPISLPNGAFNNLSILFAGASNTGIYESASNQIGVVAGGNLTVGFSSIGVLLSAAITLGWATPNFTSPGDLFLSRAAAATLQQGGADLAAPVAQIFQNQSVLAGTSNTAGVSWTFKGSKGTGTGAGGTIAFQTAPAGTTGTAQNALVTALTIDSFTHLRTGGTAPALTSCGTGSPTISGTDTAGLVTTGTAATGCVITFNIAYTSAPYCVVTWQGSPLVSQAYTVSTTAITLTQTATSGDLINYMCLAQAGG